LLKELLKHTDDDHSDRENIKKALDAVLSVSTFLNKCMFEKNARSKLKYLSSLLSETDRTEIMRPYRKFFHDGMLEFTASDIEYITMHFLNEPMYVVLLSDVLVACKENESGTRSAAFTLNLESVEKIRHVDESEVFFDPGCQDLMFRFETSNGASIVKCTSVETKEGWLRQLQTIANEMLDKKRNK
jgi:hypothetical protein